MQQMKQIKKIYVNDLTTVNLEGGPDFNNVPAFYRPVNSNYKFNIKPYSVNFIANSNDLTSVKNFNDLEIKVYPNPFDESISFIPNIQFDNIIIYDVNGKKVLETSGNIINTKSLKKGIYILKLYKSNYSSQVKVIKIKK